MIATSIPPRIYKAVAEKPPPMRADARKAPAPPAEPPRQWPQPQPRPKSKRQPIDQRILSYPLWYTRWTLLKLSWLMDFPSRGLYKAAVGINWVGQNYGKVRSFAIAHAAGPVRSKTWDVRAKSCVGCRHHYERDGQAFCKGDNGGRGCGCGHWRLARLGSKLSLSGWRCPIGNFDYGWLGRVQRRIVRLFLRSASNG